jgi:dGTPase
LEELNINPRQIISEMERHRIIRRLVGKEVSDVISATHQQLELHHIQNVADIRNLPFNLAVHSDHVKHMDRQLKDFLFANLYQHWRIMRMDRKARRFIAELFQAYISSPVILPSTIQETAQERGLYRTVCDYVAGMTDRFALQEHSKLFNSMERP